MNANSTCRIEVLSNQDFPGYDCRGDLFRLLLHNPIYPAHFVIRLPGSKAKENLPL